MRGAHSNHALCVAPSDQNLMQNPKDDESHEESIFEIDLLQTGTFIVGSARLDNHPVAPTASFHEEQHDHGKGCIAPFCLEVLWL